MVYVTLNIRGIRHIRQPFNTVNFDFLIVEEFQSPPPPEHLDTSYAQAGLGFHLPRLSHASARNGLQVGRMTLPRFTFGGMHARLSIPNWMGFA